MVTVYFIRHLGDIMDFNIAMLIVSSLTLFASFVGIVLVLIPRKTLMRKLKKACLHISIMFLYLFVLALGGSGIYMTYTFDYSTVYFWAELLINIALPILYIAISLLVVYLIKTRKQKLIKDIEQRRNNYY